MNDKKLLDICFESSGSSKMIEKAIEIENKYHRNNNHKDHGMVMLCSLYDKIFCSLFDNFILYNIFEIFQF